MTIKTIIGAALIGDRNSSPNKASVTWINHGHLVTTTHSYPNPRMVSLLLEASSQGVGITREIWS